MAMNFVKKATAPQQHQADETAQSPSHSSSSTSHLPPQSSTNGGKSFFRRGAAAKEMEEQEAAKQAARQDGAAWRFLMADGEERRITFMDGHIDAEGLLDAPRFYEHFVKHAGKPMNIVCTQEFDKSQPCPVCERGDSNPAMVGLLTVIDHTPYEIQKGQNKGKVLKNRKFLYVAKSETLKQLTHLAKKRNGSLAGCTFDVKRTGDRKPSVGDLFDFIEKQDLADVAKKHGLDLDFVQPLNYDDEVKEISVEELIKMGIGKALSGPGLGHQSHDPNMKQKLANQL